MISTDFNCLLFKVVFVAVSEHGTSSCDMFLVGQARTKSLAKLFLCLGILWELCWFFMFCLGRLVCRYID